MIIRPHGPAGIAVDGNNGVPFFGLARAGAIRCACPAAICAEARNAQDPRRGQRHSACFL
jgi:hypothetical protein